MKLLLRRDWMQGAVTLHRNMLPQWNPDILSLNTRVGDHLLASKGRAITLGLKELVYFLQKKRRMNSEIYINQVLKELELPFLKFDVGERWDTI